MSRLARRREAISVKCVTVLEFFERPLRNPVRKGTLETGWVPWGAKCRRCWRAFPQGLDLHLLEPQIEPFVQR